MAKQAQSEMEEPPIKGYFDGTWSLPNDSPYKGTIEKQVRDEGSQNEIDVDQIEAFML